jgi:hypothetical protein
VGSEGDPLTVHEKLTKAFRALIGLSLSNLFWYGLLAGGVWLFFYVAFRAKYSHRRISRKEPTPRQVSREIAYSLRSIAIFGLITGAVGYAIYSGWTQVYLRMDKYGWEWFVCTTRSSKRISASISTCGTA